MSAASPLVVHIRQPHNVYIGRGSKWGNPFVIGVHGTRRQVIAKCRAWFPTQPHLVASIHELTNQVLGCYCRPKHECHGDFLSELANPRKSLFNAVQPKTETVNKNKKRKTKKAAINMAYNPFKFLRANVKTLLFSEEKLTAEERKQNQWQMLVKFNGTHVIVGKGDVNTVFYQFGPDGARKVCFPDEILEKLEKFATKKYFLYAMVRSNGERETFFTEKAAFACDVKKGATIVGINEKGETVLMRAKTTVRGTNWQPAKAKAK